MFSLPPPLPLPAVSGWQPGGPAAAAAAAAAFQFRPSLALLLSNVHTHSLIDFMILLILCLPFGQKTTQSEALQPFSAPTAVTHHVLVLDPPPSPRHVLSLSSETIFFSAQGGT